MKVRTKVRAGIRDVGGVNTTATVTNTTTTGSTVTITDNSVNLPVA
jgi:hypothetical protein